MSVVCRDISMEGLSRKALIVMLLLVPYTKADYVEPSCSKFDFEVRVLDKLVKLEHKAEERDDKLAELEKKVHSLTENAAAVLALAQGRGTLCPNRMTAFEGSCYFIGTSTLKISAAHQFCQDRGGDLVKVDTPQKQLFLVDWLTQLGETCYWISITDMNKQGVWTGLYDNVQVNFTAWGPGEPNGGTTEDCACLSKSDQYSWVDISCSGLRSPLCEYQP